MPKPFQISKRTLKAVQNRVLRRYAGYRIKPTLLVYGVTRLCNSQCLHCRTWKEKPSKNVLAIEEIKTMLKDELFSELNHVILTGGEPSLRADIFNIIMAFHEHNPKMLIWYSTNGLLAERITDTVRNCLSEGVNLGIGVSLDGIGEHHDQIRGVKGNFRKVDRLLTKLIPFQAQRLKLSIGFTLSDLTAPYYNEVKEYAEQRGIHLLVQMFDEATFYGSQPEAPKTSQNIKEIVKALPDSLLKQHWLRLLKGETKRFSCYALHSFFFLHYNGDVSPCLRRFHEVYGNVRNQTPSEIWMDAEFGRQRVRECNPQCLNDWALAYSLKSSYFPVLLYKAWRTITR